MQSIQDKLLTRGQIHCFSLKNNGHKLFNQISKYFIFAICCIVSINALAASTRVKIAAAPEKETLMHSWSLIGSLGYTNYQNMYQHDGQTALDRLAIGKEFFSKKQLGFGLELGVQNGNAMRLDIEQTTLNELGGLPIQTTVKPLVDLLATIKFPTLGGSLFFGQLKGGIAYRRLQIDVRNTVNDLSQIASEVQAGIGYPLSKSVNLTLLYQGIYGGNPNFSVNTTTFTGHVSKIPTQQGVLLSLSLMV